MLDLCTDQGLGYTPFGPLAGGLLTGKYRFGDAYPEGSRMSLRPDPYLRWWNAETFARLDRLKSLAEARETTTAALALAWIIYHPRVTAPIIGPRRPEHFQPVVEAMQMRLDPSEHSAIGEIFEA